MRARKLAEPFAPIMVCLSCLFMMGCGGGNEPENKTRATIRQNRQLWQSRNLSSYRYTLRINAFVPSSARGPVRIEVRNGVPVSVESIPGEEPMTPELFESCNTIGKLFDKLEQASGEGAVRLDQAFESTNGYPISAYIDYDYAIADEEYGFIVTDFAPIFSGHDDSLR